MANVGSVPTDGARGELPVQLTSFVGRERELHELRATVCTTRLLTLNGVGGCGKTRLALRLAADMADAYPGGCWLVELATVVQPDRVLAVIASALGERDLSGDLTEVVVARLDGADALVVLDNCEHLLGAVATLVDVLLRRCRGLMIIATSREPLGVPGETAWRVPSLSLPAAIEEVGPGLASDAVKLFLDRAAHARPNLRVTAENAPMVTQICRRLDGIPLAIELAAARVRAMTLEQVAAGLDDRFRLLTGGARTVLPRQQTLQASVDWSYDLMSDPERAVLRRLAVFAGGFDLDAAETVASGDDVAQVEILAILLGLVDRSMVAVDGENGRYSLLETLRQYGTARLVEAGETKATRDRHLAWAVGVFDPIAEMSDGDLERDWRRDDEIENLRAAFEWAAIEGQTDAARFVATTLVLWESNSGDAAVGAAIGASRLAMPDGQTRTWLLVAAVQMFALFEVGDLRQCAVVVDAIAEHVDELDASDIRLRLLCMRMTMFSPSRVALSDEFVEAGVQLAESAGENAIVEIYASMLATRQAFAGDWRAARASAARVDRGRRATIAGQNALLALAMSATWTGDFDVARRHFDAIAEARVVRRHPRLVAGEDATLTYLDLAQGRDTGAAGRVMALIDDARRRRFLAGVAIAGWAPGVWALGHGDVDAALRLFAAWREETGRLNLGGIWGVLSTHAWLAAGDLDAARAEVDRAQPGPAEAQWFLRDARVTALRGLIAAAAGDLASAERYQHAALTAHHDGGWRPDLVHSLEALAVLAAAGGSSAECARLAGAAAVLRDSMGYVLRWPYEQRTLDDALTRTHAELGSEEFAAVTLEGRRLESAEAVAYAQRSRGERKRPSVGWESLTPTEEAVARHAALGLTNRDIGRELFMGTETVKTHLSHIYDKVGVRRRTALATLVASMPDPAPPLG